MKIMILSDGETWTNINGCEIREITPQEMVKAMSESTTPQGKTCVTFTGYGIAHVHVGILAVRGA